MVTILPKIYTSNSKIELLERVIGNEIRLNLRDLGLVQSPAQYICGVEFDSYGFKQIGDLFLPSSVIDKTINDKIKEMNNSTTSHNLYDGVDPVLVEMMKSEYSSNDDYGNTSITPFNVFLFYSDSDGFNHGMLNENVLLPPNSLDGLTITHLIPNVHELGIPTLRKLSENISSYITKMQNLLEMYR